MIATRLGRANLRCPIIRRSAGRASISKLTIELTGLPGRPKIRGAVDRAERERLGRLDRDLHPRHVGDAAEHGLDDVVVAHADATTRDDRVALDRSLTEHSFEAGLVVADGAHVVDVAARIAQQAGQHVTRLLSRI